MVRRKDLKFGLWLVWLVVAGLEADVSFLGSVFYLR